MAFDKIKTKYDYKIDNLIEKLTKEIIKATPKEGFPYIEHTYSISYYIRFELY
jgi:hypothetical protein